MQLKKKEKKINLKDISKKTDAFTVQKCCEKIKSCVTVSVWEDVCSCVKCYETRKAVCSLCCILVMKK